jgi:hypothetical protein
MTDQQNELIAAFGAAAAAEEQGLRGYYPRATIALRDEVKRLRQELRALAPAGQATAPEEKPYAWIARELQSSGLLEKASAVRHLLSQYEMEKETAEYHGKRLIRLAVLLGTEPGRIEEAVRALHAQPVQAPSVPPKRERDACADGSAFELWWAEHMPDAEQCHAWLEWCAIRSNCAARPTQPTPTPKE